VASRITDVKAARSCRILFVSASEAARLAEILAAVADWSVLTVSEVERLPERGGIINFLMDGQRVRFRINLGTATRAGLKISSKLLQLGVGLDEKRKN